MTDDLAQKSDPYDDDPTVADEPVEFTAAPPDVIPPKRGRGRPKGSGTKTTTTRRTTTAVKADLRDQIAGTLHTINFAFLFVPDEFKNDAFTDEEIEELATTLNDAALANKTLHKYLSTVLLGSGFSTWAPLLLCVGKITARRLDNHNINLSSLFSSNRQEMEMQVPEMAQYDYSDVREPIAYEP